MCVKTKTNCPYASCDNDVIKNNICGKCQNYVIKCENCGSTNKLNSLYCRRCGKEVNFDRGATYYCNKANLCKNSSIYIPDSNFEMLSDFEYEGKIAHSERILSNWIVGYGIIAYLLCDNNTNKIFLAVFSIEQKSLKKYYIENLNLIKDELEYKLNLYFCHGYIFFQTIKKFIKIEFELTDFNKNNDDLTLSIKVIHDSNRLNKDEEICVAEVVRQYFIIGANLTNKNMSKLYFYDIVDYKKSQNIELTDNLIHNLFYDEAEHIYIVCETKQNNSSRFLLKEITLNNSISGKTSYVCELKEIQRSIKGNPKNFAFYNNTADKRSILFYAGTDKCYKQGINYSNQITAAELNECSPQWNKLSTVPYITLSLKKNTGSYNGIFICGDSHIYISSDSDIDNLLKKALNEINNQTQDRISEELITLYSDKNEGILFARGGQIHLIYTDSNTIKKYYAAIPDNSKISHLLYYDRTIYALSIDNKTLYWFKTRKL